VIEAPTWVAQAITRFVFDLSKVYMIGMGLLLLAGGQQRMSGPAYYTLTTWAPWWVWGGTMLLLGVYSLIPFLMVRLACYTLAAAWFWVWEAAVVVNAFNETALLAAMPNAPRPGWTAISAYGFSATLFTAMAVAMWLDRAGKGGGWLSTKWREES